MNKQRLRNILILLSMSIFLLTICLLNLKQTTDTFLKSNNNIYFSEEGIIYNGKILSMSDINDMILSNYPTLDEVKSDYPSKTVLTWIVSSVNILDAITKAPTNAVNKYLDSLGLDIAVCFIPIINHDDFYCDMINQLINSGEQVDILSPSYSWSYEGFENNYQRDALLGILEPLDSYFLSSSSGKSYMRSMPEDYFDAFRIEGTIYGISGTATNILTPTGYSVDKELMEKYGWNVKMSIYEQIDILKKAQNDDESLCPVYCENFGNPLYYPYRFDNWAGVFWNNKEGKVECITLSKEYKAQLSLLYFLMQNNMLTYNETLDASSCFIYLKLQQYTMNNLPIDQVAGSIESERIQVPYDNYKITNISNAIGISSKSIHKEKAFELIILTQTDKQLNNLLIFGDNSNADVNFNETEMGQQNILINFLRYGNLSICKSFQEVDNSADADYYNLYVDLDYVPYTGFAFDVEPVKKEYIKIKEIMFTHDFLKYLSAEESIKALEDKLKKAGVDKFISEINRQYTLWKENDIQ